jgi:hypothetical protein
MPPRPVAHGDGCHDDTEAIQAGLDALRRRGSQPEECEKDASLDSWPPYFAGLYLPAGLYRITTCLEIPFAQHFRIFGDGERGGQFVDYTVPTGTMIRQDTDGEPIFVFRELYTHSWAIEQLGFTWRNQQGPPDGWTPSLDDAKQIAPGVTEPGACAILFSGTPGAPATDFYHGRISNCQFTGGWRGISFDDSFTDGKMSLWNTRMEGLNMFNVLGAGLSLVAANGGIGMPVNSFRNSFIDNPQVQNLEDRIQIAQQGSFLLENVTLEHSSTRAISCTDCTMTMRNVSVEHAAIRKAFGKMIYFGGGSYTVDTFGFDGWMDGKDAQGNRGFCTIFNADGKYPNPDDERAIGSPTTVVLSNVRAYPVDPNAPDPDVGGFIPLNEPVVLLAGATNTEYVVLNAPNLPVFPQLRRAAEWDSRFGTTFGTYRELQTFTNGFGEIMSSAVKMPEVKKTVQVPLGTIPAKSLGTVRVSLVTSPPGSPPLSSPPSGQPRARPGDLVRLGPPGNFPAGLTSSGVVVVNNTVDVRVFNTTASAVTVPNALWTIEVSGGPLSGVEQFIPDQPLVAEPFP